MCGRYALKTLHPEIVARFALDAWDDRLADYAPRYNIAPGTDIPVIRRSPEGRRVLHPLRWGLVPHWAKDTGIGSRLTNARGETVHEKPAFRDPFRRRRCLIPADGFYEWQRGSRQPFYFSLADGQPMALAGLWESWKAPDGSVLRSVCVVTSAANALMAPVHERMPVIVEPGRWGDWLGESEKAVADLLMPFSADGLRVWPVNRRVGSAANDDDQLIVPCS